MASGCLSLLADATRRGGSDDPDDYFAMIDPISGHPKRLVLARIDGVLARVERDLTTRRGGGRRRRRDPGTPAAERSSTSASSGHRSQLTPSPSVQSGAASRASSSSATSGSEHQVARSGGSTTTSKTGGSIQSPASSSNEDTPVGFGSREWFERVGPDAPLYYDTSHKKRGKSKDRYRKYMSAKTAGEYLTLHSTTQPPGDRRMIHGRPYTRQATEDFKFDFDRGYVRLLAAGALMSFGSSQRKNIQLFTTEYLESREDVYKDIYTAVGNWVDYDVERS